MNRVQARLVRIPLRAMLLTGAVAGSVPGLFLGCLLGAFLSWLCGTIVSWQRELGFTLGISPQLLPFGDQGPLLAEISQQWPLVVPLCGLLMALFWGLVVAISYGLLGATLNLLRAGPILHLDVDLEGVSTVAPEGPAAPVRTAPAPAPEAHPES